MKTILHTIVSCAIALTLFSAGTYADETAAAETPENISTRIGDIPEKGEKSVFDFRESSKNWRIINDGVMGGLSSSKFRIAQGTAIFEGNVSLENNGGFASVRSRPEDTDLSGSQGILLRVRGDGKKYAFRLRTTASFDGVSYQHRFKTVKNKWITVDIPFTAFKPVFRGRIVKDAKPLDLKLIKTVGFLISDKQTGAFRLEIDWIKAYKKSTAQDEESDSSKDE